MLVLYVRGLDQKLQPDPNPHNCAYYVNVATHRGQNVSSYAGFAQESYNVVRAEFYSEVMRIEETFGTESNCDAESCPDSVEILLYTLCDTSNSYEAALIDRIVFK
jgi:hypothetical protein